MCELYLEPIKIEMDEVPMLNGIFITNEYNARLIYDLSYHSFGNFQDDSVNFMHDSYIVQLDRQWTAMGVKAEDFVRSIEHLKNISSTNSTFIKLIYSFSNFENPIEIISDRVFLIHTKFEIPGFGEYLKSFFITPLDKNNRLIGEKLHLTNRATNKYMLADKDGVRFEFVINNDVRRTKHLLETKQIDITTSTNIPDNMSDTTYTANYQKSNLVYYLKSKNRSLSDILRALRQEMQAQYFKHHSELLSVDSFIYEFKKTEECQIADKSMSGSWKNQPIVIATANYKQNIDILASVCSVFTNAKIPYRTVIHQSLRDLLNDDSADVVIGVAFRLFDHYASYVLQLLDSVSQPKVLLASLLKKDLKNIQRIIDRESNYVAIFRGNQVYYKNEIAKEWEYDSNGYLRRSGLQL